MGLTQWATQFEKSQGLVLSPMNAIEVEGVRVAYRSYKERPSSLKESVLRFIKFQELKHYETFDALADLSFNVKKGEIIGIIGSNGSGKSTLLKVLSGVLKPVSGRVALNGSLASLIELGAGFDPELNALDNILLNGSLHRRSLAQMQSRIKPILDFAELNDFATTPIKYFSSGMYARLGFSAAIDINPDVLLVDEILAVGDERFQTKCHEVIKQLFSSGKTIVIVSHDLKMVAETARRCILLAKGHLVYDGDPQTAIAMYRDQSYQTFLA